MAKKKSNINKYINDLGLNEVYSKMSRGSSFIPGVIDDAKLSSRVVKKDESYKPKPFNKSVNNIRPILEPGFSSRGNFRTKPLAATVYLLDTYSGAAAAYSVRRLSSSYSGSALRVRRSSDNTEQDIGFVGENLDTASMESFVGVNNGFVVTWYDQSGNGIDFTQSSAANQPQIVSSGSVITDGGLAAVSFDGIDDNMTSLLNFNGTALTQIIVNNYDYTANTSTYPHLWSGPSYENRAYAVGKTGLSYYTSGSGLSSSGVITDYTTNGYNGVKTILSFTMENSGGGYDLNANLNNDTVINKTNSNVPLSSITSQILGAWPVAGGNTQNVGI